MVRRNYELVLDDSSEAGTTSSSQTSDDGFNMQQMREIPENSNFIPLLRKKQENYEALGIPDSASRSESQTPDSTIIELSEQKLGS